jgi:hypothetical protein
MSRCAAPNRLGSAGERHDRDHDTGCVARAGSRQSSGASVAKKESALWLPR